MSRVADQSLVIGDLRGGSNNADPPTWIPDTQCIEAMNVDWWEGTFARKRLGSTQIGTTFTSGGPFTNQISSMMRHVPGFDQAASEQWAVDLAGNIGRQAGAATWTAPSKSDNVASTQGTLNVNGVSLGGFFWMAYDSSVNRLHVWDPALGAIRRVGLAPGVAPTLASLGGAGLTFTRHYAVRFTDVSGSDIRRRSERGPEASLAISDDAGIRVTRPAAPGESETHWEVIASDTGDVWYRIAVVAIATTTYDDTAATIDTSVPDASGGINLLPPSARFIQKINSRLVMGGAWETGLTGTGETVPKDNRLWWTAVIGANDVGDLERVPSGFYADVAFAITAISPPFMGSIYIFGQTNIAKAVPTGLVGANAFQMVDVSTNVGCIRHQTIAMGVDEFGQQCVYFLSTQGPYRLSTRGLQYMGNDREDIWAIVNQDAESAIAHTVYHTDRHQWWVWVATGSSNYPTLRMTFDSRLGRTLEDAVVGGWSRADGTQAEAWCSCMWPETLGATMSRSLLPYMGRVLVNSRILRCDDPAATTDDSVAFRAYVTTKVYALAQIGTHVEIIERFLLGLAASGVTITCVVIRDTDSTTAGYTTTSSVTLSATGSESYAVRKFDTGELAGLTLAHFQIGDASAVANTWRLDQFLARYRVQEPA